MSGAGFSAAGTSPAGFGDVDTAPVPANRMYVDQFGVRRNARRIDPATQNYVLDPVTGMPQGMSYVAQQVYLIVKTVLGTSALPSVGLPQSRRLNTGSFPKDLERDLRNALSGLVTKNLMQIVSISIVMNTNQQSYGSMRWRDLTVNNGAEQELSLQ